MKQFGRNATLSVSVATTIFFCMVGLVGGCVPRDQASQTKAEGVQAGELRGIAKISSIVRDRLLSPQDPGTADFNVQRIVGPGLTAVESILGASQQTGTTRTYAYGIPNPMNVLLWSHVLHRFAASVVQGCRSNPGVVQVTAYEDENANQLNLSLSDGFGDQVLALCHSVGLTAKPGSETSVNLPDYSKLWDIVMSLRASHASKDEWLAAIQVLNQASSYSDPTERVRNVLMSLFLHPEFLLEKG